jgi:exonuclease SbcD
MMEHAGCRQGGFRGGNDVKILHTSDWHLGKLFHAVNMIEDQRHVLKQIVAMVEDEKPDAVVVAGDIYDRAVPSADAVDLLDWVLTELVDRLATPTILIAGNHDSPDRLQFGSTLLRKNGLHVVGRLDGDLAPVRVGKDADTGFLCPVPFVEPAAAREYLGDSSLVTHEAALRAILGRFMNLIPTGAPSVLVAHAYVAGGSTSDSERAGSVGGADQVAADCFDGFSYAALGHLHRSQNIGGPRIRYSGSLLKLSRSEAATAKSVSLVEIGADGKPTVRELELAPKRDVREIEGLLADIEAGACADGNAEDYLYVKLLDTAMPVNAMSRLRVRFPNVVDVNVSTAIAATTGAAEGRSLNKLDDITMFGEFMKAATDHEMTADERNLVTAAIEATATAEVMS